MENACLKTDSGLLFIIGINKKDNLLSLKAKDDTRGIDLVFETEDYIDDLNYINAVWGPYNPIKGKKVFVHEGTLLYKNRDGSIELRSCPIDIETGQPVAALVVHYRFETVPGVDALRISSWFTKDEPCIAETLHWLNLVPVKVDFDTLIGYEPDCQYPLNDVTHSLRFPTLALDGRKGWAILTDCGEAIFTPGNNDANELQGNQRPCRFKPRATTVNQVNLTLYGKANPLTATLVIGTGDVAMPKLPVPQFAPAPVARGEAFSLESGMLKLTIMNRSDGCSMLAMNTKNWQPISGKAGMAPLLRMLVKNLETGEMRTLSSEAGWRQSKIKCFDGGMQIYLQEPGDIQDFAVAVEVRVARKNRLEWRTKVLNTNPDYTVLYATYPSVNFEDPGRAAGEEDSLVLFTPKDSGSLIRKPYKRGYHYNGFYPHGVETPMAYMGLYHADAKSNNGFYIGLHDVGGSRKEMTADFSTQGSACFEFVCIAQNINKPANAFELPGVMVWELFDGDWYDMTCIYRDFIRNQAPWLPVHGRKDSPAWMRDVPLYIRDRMPSSDNPDSLKYPQRISFGQDRSPDDWYEKPIRLAKALGLPIGYHLYDWHWCTYDNDYPNYFPVKEGLKEGVHAMHEHNIYVMPYINGRLWDTHDRRGEDYRFTREAFAHASKKDGGRPYTEFYNSFEPDGRRVELAVMCPSTWRWRDEILKITRRLCTEYHMDGVYIDQISCAVQSPCEDPSHNHTAGNGSWWRESYKLLMQRVRAEALEGCGFTSESNSEIFTDQFDGFLTWTWLNSNLVPAFPLIYSGYIAMFGRNSDRVGRTDDLFARYHLAQSLMFGQQLGWINPDVVDNADLLPYLKKIATYRYKYRNYFNEGDMLRPPKLHGNMPVFVTDSAMGESMMFEGEMLMASAWCRRADGSTLVMLANISDEEADCSFIVPWEEYGLRPDCLAPVDGEGNLKGVSSDGLKAYLPPRSCLILKSNE